MICRMCLLESTEALDIFGTETTQFNIAETICKHFWFEINKKDEFSTTICNTCWWRIESFHLYYLSVEEAQKKLTAMNFLPSEQPVKVEVVFLKQEVVPENIVKNEDEEFSIIGYNLDDASQGEISSDGEPLEDLKVSDGESQAEGVVTRGARNLKLQNATGLSPKCETSDEVSSHNLNEDSVLQKKRGRKKKSETIIREETVETEYRKKSKQLDAEIAKQTKLKCDLCISEFPIFSQLQRHYRTEHRRKGYVVCCTKKFFKRGLYLDHISKHVNPERFKCAECDKVYANRRALQNHLYSHAIKMFQCDQCPRRFARQYLLNHHKLVHTPKDHCTFFCEECGKGFNTNNSLQTHRRYIHENAYAQMCHVCAKLIRGKSLFAKHQREHAGITEPKQQCQECGVWLKNAFRLRLHMKKHLESENEHICNICGKSSPSSVALQSHIRYVHSAKRQHQCSFCDKAFKKALTLKEHMTTHTGDVLYTCPHCPKTFNSRSNMHSHRKKVHRQEWEEARKIRGIPPELLNRIEESVQTDTAMPANNSLRIDEVVNAETVNHVVGDDEEIFLIMK